MTTDYLKARFHAGHLILALTSFVCVFVVALAYEGRLRSLEQSRSVAMPAHFVDLNSVSNAKELEPSLERLFADPIERRSAARSLFDFIRSERSAGRTLPNVGAILKAAWPA